MPIYEYECKDCGHRMEKLQKISDAPLATCPACNEEALTKLVSAAGFRLKGGGWYETDFKKDGKKNLAGDGAQSKGESSTDGASKDTKSSDKSGGSADSKDKGAKSSSSGSSAAA